MTTPRRRGRPLSPAVTREGICAAALGIVGEEGYEKLTMARIARRLGVAPSALYNHIASKHELLLLLQDAVMGEVSVVELRQAARGELPVAEAMRAWARSYRAVFAAHPPLIPVIATLPIAGAPSTLEVYEAVAAALARTALPTEQVLARVIALESFIYGSAYDVGAPAEIFDVPDDGASPAFQRAAAAFRGRGRDEAAGARTAGDEAPAAERRHQEATGRNPHADAPFEAGLDLLLADLEG